MYVKGPESGEKGAVFSSVPRGKNLTDEATAGQSADFSGAPPPGWVWSTKAPHLLEQSVAARLLGYRVVRGCRQLPKEKILTDPGIENTAGMEALLVLEHAIWLLPGAGRGPPQGRRRRAGLIASGLGRLGFLQWFALLFLLSPWESMGWD